MALPGSSFAGGMPGEPTTPSVPRVNYGKPTPVKSVKTVKVKAHTRQVAVGNERRAYLPNDPAALQKFQKFQGLPVTGKWDPATQQYAHSHNTRLVSSGRYEDLLQGAQNAPQQAASPSAPAIDPTTKSLIDAAVRLKFGGQEQGLNQQLAANTRFANGAPAWYQQAVQQIKAQAQPVPQTAMPAPTGDPAQDSRNAAAYGYQQERNNAIGAGNQFLTNVGAGLTAASANSVNASNAQRQNLLSQQTQLKGQEGDFRTTTMGDINAAQAKSDVENRKIQAGIYIAQGRTDMAQKVLDSLNQDRTVKNKIAKTNARTTRIKTAHDTMLADKKYNLDQQKFGAAQAKDNYQRTHGLGPYKVAGAGSNKSNGRYTQTQLNHYDNQWNGAVALANHLKAAKTYVDKQTKQTKPVTRDVAYSALLKQYKNDPEFAAAAADLVFGRTLGQHDLHVLATKGVHPKIPMSPQRTIDKITAQDPAAKKLIQRTGG